METIERETFPSPGMYDKNSGVVKEFASKMIKSLSMMESVASNIKSESSRIIGDMKSEDYQLMKKHNDALEQELKQFFDKYDYMIKKVLKKSS